MKIQNVHVYGLNESIIASGYPMKTTIEQMACTNVDDLNRSTRLSHSVGGSGHDCFLKGIIVQLDLTVPQYFWQQAKRYHWFDIVSSQSTMHKILKMDMEKSCNEYVHPIIKQLLSYLIHAYTEEKYTEADILTYKQFGKVDANNKEELFKAIISNIPSGLELTARVSTNYLQLKTIYKQRRAHKLSEWREVCKWMETLPLFKDLIV